MTPVDYIARTDTIQIATDLRDGGEVVTPIWGVIVDGVPYIRSAYGKDSKWYKRVQRTGHAAFVDGASRYSASIENVPDEQVTRRVDAAYEAKYAAQGDALREVVADPVREYTMRVNFEGQ
ncbi:hypothetical protein GA0115240_103210 [Streptomyces sp. DvalAA-14]|uniref:DUF2255 family protein n=1 Tax=unclassified Streptomyces TaxID=2593676 RepID=UPI00081B06DF|nr:MULTISPECIES: DUF2255 family protein [unclassified Streptomyces]MYS19032.1 DUF2255 family protein [Streptomyces sp. SID4948]SCD34519.1 hypothetical protein GA0115240_103210 [Streptomyces sp. DvalAA-14]